MTSASLPVRRWSENASPTGRSWSPGPLRALTSQADRPTGDEVSGHRCRCCHGRGPTTRSVAGGHDQGGGAEMDDTVLLERPHSVDDRFTDRSAFRWMALQSLHEERVELHR